MGIIIKFKRVAQGIMIQGIGIQNKFKVIYKETSEAFQSFDSIPSEKKIGVDFNPANKEKPGEIPLDAPAGQVPRGAHSKNTSIEPVGYKQILPFLLLPLLANYVGRTFLIVQTAEVLYQNMSKQTNTYCNILIPEGLDETNSFTQNFDVMYLLPVASFTPTDYIKKITERKGCSEVEVFQNFLFYQQCIVTITRKGSCFLFTLLVLVTVLRICQVFIMKFVVPFMVQNMALIGPALVTNNVLILLVILVIIIITSLAFLITPVPFLRTMTIEACIIMVTLVKLIISVLVSIVRSITAVNVNPGETSRV